MTSLAGSPPTAPVRSAPVRPVAGSFRFWFANRRWEWSSEVYRMHGYLPGEVEPTAELLLAHKHPDDREHVAEAITRSPAAGQPFSGTHRFIDVAGREHTVAVVADSIVDDEDRPVGTAGFYIDLTDTLAAAEHDTLTRRLPQLIEARAVIEQAKGVLMHMYRIDADQAFRILVWRSQETNTKLRALAEQLVAELDRLPAPTPATVAVFDHILLSVHERTPH